MKKTSLIIGLIGAIIFAAFGVVLLYLPNIVDISSGDAEIFRYIGFVAFGYAALGVLLSALSLKSKAACVILIILGAFMAQGLLGLFYIFAGYYGMQNHKKASQATTGEVMQGNANIQLEAKPVENHINEDSEEPEESHVEIDISSEQRPKGRRFGGKWYPSKAWFSDNGIPVKEVPVDKRTLKNLDDEQKYVVALASFSIVKLKAIFIILALIAAIIIGSVASSMSDNMWSYVFIVIILLFGGGFIVVKPAKLIDGFTIVNGTFKDRIGLPFYWDLLFCLASLIGSLWSFFPSVLLTLFDMTRREKMLSLPRVGVPQNIGMDDMIEVYSAYERACSIDDAFNQSAAAAAERNYKTKQNELDSLKTRTANSDLSASDKQAIINRADEIQQKNEQIYNDKIKPNL